MSIIAYQALLRPALPEIFGPKEYRDERELFIRIDELITVSGLEAEFIELSMKHRKFDPDKHKSAGIEAFCRSCVLALRTNIARHIKTMDHREFCTRLADSPLLQWFLQIGRVDKLKTFAKSTSDRYAQWIDAESLHSFNEKLTALLAGINIDPGKAPDLDLAEDIDFENIYFDSTCLKAPIHYPVDWVLLRDATRTLVQSLVLIRESGLRNRMPKAPLALLSDINTLCMKMTAKNRTQDGLKHRKAVLREMKKQIKRTAKHAQKHLDLLLENAEQTDLSSGRIRCISENIQNVLDKLPAAIKQAHERIIGGRKLPNKEKVLSLYDEDVQVIVRGKSGAEVEFGNNLWIGETGEGYIVDYLLEKQKTSDAKQIVPAIGRLVQAQHLAVARVWGDRGLHSADNEKFLKEARIYSGLCPKNVSELAERLGNDEGMREGLKRRAGTEARISIIIRDFMGKPARAKGFKHREMMVGWAVMSHNLWVLARQPRRSSMAEAA